MLVIARFKAVLFGETAQFEFFFHGISFPVCGNGVCVWYEKAAQNGLHSVLHLQRRDARNSFCVAAVSRAGSALA